MEFEKVIINFKPAELRELEQLANAAGIISVSDFAKQKLLALLTSDKEEVIKAEAASGNANLSQAIVAIEGKTWQQLILELDRLHKELRMFVKESSVNPDENTLAEQKRDQLKSKSQPAASAPSSTEFSETLIEQAIARFTRPAEPAPKEAPVVKTEKRIVSGDPLDDLLEKELLKVQGKGRPKQIQLSKAQSKPAAHSSQAKEEESEAFADQLPSPVDPGEKESQDSISSQSAQTFKETPPNLSGNPPPKKRRS